MHAFALPYMPGLQSCGRWSGARKVAKNKLRAHGEMNASAWLVVCPSGRCHSRSAVHTRDFNSCVLFVDVHASGHRGCFSHDGALVDFFQGNCFSGCLPHTLGQLGRLWTLGLRDNELSGRVRTCFVSSQQGKQKKYRWME